MRPKLSAIAARLIANVTSSQVILFSEDLETGTLAPEWIWQGSAPLFTSPGGFDGSMYCLGKESWDQSVPPVTNGAGPLVFHPIPFDSTVQYSVSVDMRVSNPLNITAIANCGLTWFDPVTGDFSGGGLFSTDTTWQQLFSPPTYYYPAPWWFGPNAQFGVALVTNPSATGAFTFYDNIVIEASDMPTVMAPLPEHSVVTVFPNPVTDEVVITLANDVDVADVSVIDQQGRLVRIQRVRAGGDHMLDTSDLAAGTYLLRVSSATGATTQYLVKL